VGVITFSVVKQIALLRLQSCQEFIGSLICFSRFLRNRFDLKFCRVWKLERSEKNGRLICSVLCIGAIIYPTALSTPSASRKGRPQTARGALASFSLVQNFLDTLPVNATDFVLTDFATKRQLILLQEYIRVKVPQHHQTHCFASEIPPIITCAKLRVRLLIPKMAAIQNVQY
jgi:hypothetical protein